MGLTRYKLEDLIELQELRNDQGLYSIEDVRGVNNLKELIKTKANLSGRDLTKFQVVEPGVFFFNHRTSRNGSKISITYNYEDKPIIVTEDYVLFLVKDESILSPVWLYLFFCRAEFDRYTINNSWGSSTEFFNWEDICDVEIDLPPIEIQQKYVNIYNAMVANQKCYEDSLGDLKLACDAELEHLKKTCDNWVRVGDVIEEVDIRNQNLECAKPYGVTMDKQIVLSKANSKNLKLYKILEPGNLACNLLHIGRDKAYPLAINDGDRSLAISQSYFVFKTLTALVPEYFISWFSRDEIGRHGWFLCDDSIRGSISLNRFLDINIPLPDQTTQESIAKMRLSYQTRRSINERMKAQIKDICPILIKGSLEEAGRS